MLCIRTASERPAIQLLWLTWIGKENPIENATLKRRVETAVNIQYISRKTCEKYTNAHVLTSKYQRNTFQK